MEWDHEYSLRILSQYKIFVSTQIWCEGLNIHCSKDHSATGEQKLINSVQQIGIDTSELLNKDGVQAYEVRILEIMRINTSVI